MREELGIVEGEMEIDPVKTGKRIKETIEILHDLDLPRAQQNNRSALTLLALLDMKADTPGAMLQALCLELPK